MFIWNPHGSTRQKSSTVLKTVGIYSEKLLRILIYFIKAHYQWLGFAPVTAFLGAGCHHQRALYFLTLSVSLLVNLRIAAIAFSISWRDSASELVIYCRTTFFKYSKFSPSRETFLRCLEKMPYIYYNVMKRANITDNAMVEVQRINSGVGNKAG